MLGQLPPAAMFARASLLVASLAAIACRPSLAVDLNAAEAVITTAEGDLTIHVCDTCTVGVKVAGRGTCDLGGLCGKRGATGSLI